MQNNDCGEKYYGLGARASIEARRKEWTPELLANAQQDWLRLFHDVEEALEEARRARLRRRSAFAGKRWSADSPAEIPKWPKGLNRMYADRPNWPARRVMKCGTAH